MSENSLKDVNLDSRANDSSLKSLVARTGETLSNLLQGPNSLGAYIEDGIVNNKTIEAVPSDTNLHPDGKKYFAAASSPITNGHRDNIDVLQIEMHKNYRDNLVDRALHQNEYAAALGNAFLNFYTRYYGKSCMVSLFSKHSLLVFSLRHYTKTSINLAKMDSIQNIP